MNFNIGDRVKLIHNPGTRYLHSMIDNCEYGIITGWDKNSEYTRAHVDFKFKDSDKIQPKNCYMNSDYGGYVQEIERIFSIENVIKNLEKLEEKL